MCVCRAQKLKNNNYQIWSISIVFYVYLGHVLSWFKSMDVLMLTSKETGYGMKWTGFIHFINHFHYWWSDSTKLIHLLNTIVTLRNIIFPICSAFLIPNTLWYLIEQESDNLNDFEYSWETFFRLTPYYQPLPPPNATQRGKKKANQKPLQVWVKCRWIILAKQRGEKISKSQKSFVSIFKKKFQLDILKQYFISQ